MKKLSLENDCFIAENQQGNLISFKGKYPRKALLSTLGVKSARKMYIDDTDGDCHHIGYIIGNMWWTIYKLNAWEGK